MKPPLRTKSVGTKVSEAEFALLEERARGAGVRLGGMAKLVNKVCVEFWPPEPHNRPSRPARPLGGCAWGEIGGHDKKF